MKLSLTIEHLNDYVATQAEHFFPDGSINRPLLGEWINKALERVEYCFAHINVKNYFDGQQVLFSHLHSDQYATFLYYLSNTIWKLTADSQIASKFYLLNKALHAADCYYEIQLPDIFLLAHPVGIVLGRAQYSNYLVVYQHCTVGTNLDFQQPVFEEGIVLFGGCTVIGNCHIGSNSWFQTGALVMDKDIPQNQIVFGGHPNVNYRPTTRSVSERYFRNFGNDIVS